MLLLNESLWRRTSIRVQHR